MRKGIGGIQMQTQTISSLGKNSILDFQISIRNNVVLIWEKLNSNLSSRPHIQ